MARRVQHSYPEHSVQPCKRRLARMTREQAPAGVQLRTRGTIRSRRGPFRSYSNEGAVEPALRVGNVHARAVRFVQRFGPSPNLHVGLHACVLDGVYFYLIATNHAVERELRHATRHKQGPPGGARARRANCAERRGPSPSRSMAEDDGGSSRRPALEESATALEQGLDPLSSPRARIDPLMDRVSTTRDAKAALLP